MEALPEEFWQGVEQFNQQEYYSCHDTLEAIWMEAVAPEKQFYQGILQIAVGLYHLGNQNWRGAVVLMGEGISRLAPYQPDYAGIDVELFLEQVGQLLRSLQQIGPDRVMLVLAHLGYGTSVQAVPESEMLLEPLVLPRISLLPEAAG